MRHPLRFVTYFSSLLLLLFLAAAFPALPSEGPTTLFIVRHAEKVDDGTKDPPLADEGHARAEALARLLRDAGLNAVYATPYRRTQETAARLAEQLNLHVTTYEAQGAALADTLRSRHTGQQVLVVGHSNTVPMLLNALLGAERYQQLGEMEYDALFVVTLAENGTAGVALLRYGD